MIREVIAFLIAAAAALALAFVLGAFLTLAALWELENM